MCEEEKKEKKFSFVLLIWYGLLAYIAVALTIYEIIPHGMNMIRKTNIIKERVKPDFEFIKKHPTKNGNKQILESVRIFGIFKNLFIFSP